MTYDLISGCGKNAERGGYSTHPTGKSHTSVTRLASARLSSSISFLVRPAQGIIYIELESVGNLFPFNRVSKIDEALRTALCRLSRKVALAVIGGTRWVRVIPLFSVELSVNQMGLGAVILLWNFFFALAAKDSHSPLIPASLFTLILEPVQILYCAHFKVTSSIGRATDS